MGTSISGTIFPSRIYLSTVSFYMEGLYMINPLVALASMALIIIFNLIAGLIPVYFTMRKTPAQILARTDI